MFDLLDIGYAPTKSIDSTQKRLQPPSPRGGRNAATRPSFHQSIHPSNQHLQPHPLRSSTTGIGRLEHRLPSHRSRLHSHPSVVKDVVAAELCVCTRHPPSSHSIQASQSDAAGRYWHKQRPRSTQIDPGGRTDRRTLARRGT